MSNRILKKWIGNDQIDANKILLDNNTAVRSKDSSNVTVDMMKISSDDKLMVFRSSGAEEMAYQSDVSDVAQDLSDHLSDAEDAHNASAISLSPAVNGETDVQASLEDHESRIDSLEVGGGDTKKVLISSNDTTEGFLEDKIVGASGKIAISTLNDGGNEDLQITIGSDVFDKTSDDAGDISVTPNGNMSSTNVQAALQEIQGDVDGCLRNIVEDTTPQLGGHLDVNGKYIQNFDGTSVLFLSKSTGDQIFGTISADAPFIRLESDYSQIRLQQNLDLNSSAKVILESYENDIMMTAGASNKIDVHSDIQMNSKKVKGLAAGGASGEALRYNEVGSYNAGVGYGLATLDSGGKIPSEQLPNTVMEYKGTWDASTNTPALANGSPANNPEDAGHLYIVSVGGTVNFGAGNITFNAGDTVILSASLVWEKSTTANLVTSVNGYQGVVSLDTDDISEGSLNLYYTSTRFDNAFSAKDTDDLSEGSTNLYFTSTRAKGAAVSDSITDGITDVAPSQNAVHDALALKFDSSNFSSSFSSELATKTTDNLSEGSTNKYFTDARAKSAAVSDTAYGSGWNGTTDVAPSKNAVYDEMQLAKGRLDALEAVVADTYKETLEANDISNGYIDLPHLAVQTMDFHVFADRLALHQGAGEDYTLSTVSGVTRITFLNQMIGSGSQALAVDDSIYVRFKRNA